MVQDNSSSSVAQRHQNVGHLCFDAGAQKYFFYPKMSHEFVLLTTGLLLLDDSLWKTIAVNPHML